MSGRAVRQIATHRFLRYAAVSGLNVVLGNVVLVVMYAVVKLGPVAANIVATVAASGPAFYLSKKWVWSGRGHYHLVWELLPFWVIALIGLGVSTGSADVAAEWARHVTSSRLEQALVVAAAVVIASSVVWLARYIFFNQVVWRERVAGSQQLGPG